ncbi:MAG: NADH-quinone oxidoreductase subunit L [Syntrophobacteraceae bacterium]|jgi:NADH-quinone oxidoreductase subunit L|nr:NADH-quinone oxidoreductase subunit L [Syntrophobacteraceae bacterium]
MTTSWAQNATLAAVIVATVLPLLAFAVIFLFTRSRPRLSARLSIGAVTASLGCSLFLLGGHWGMEKPVQFTARWLVSASVEIPFGFLLDPLSLLMLAIVAVISFLVQVYSLGYMAGDPGFSRYYAFMSLFAWAMMNLTVAPTLLQLFIFWELVGLASYLLIGFWIEKFSATQAGKKAFVMTRAGDVAFFLGFLVVLLALGNLSILEINGPRVAELMAPAGLTLAALLIFGGIVGKSAQFPLLTWLPDAMEGPTPVSALLHSATMVAAGVYLFARLFPFFSLSPTAMSVFLAVGTLSMLLASTMAMVSRDIKKIWAYSTISQLGLMIMALAAGGYFAGVFHLTTHAAFKALLFLCSGVFIHLVHTNDIFELSSADCRRFRTPAVCMIVAAAALSGLPPLAGFFSKEAVMAQLAGLANPVWFAAGVVGVFLTAYYTFRLVFVVFIPREEPAETGFRGEEHAHVEEDHASEYRAMAWPLMVLAVLTLILGFLEHPLKGFLEGYSRAAAAHDDGPGIWVTLLPLGMAAAGLGLAWLEFGRKAAPRVGFVDRVPAVHRLFAERWYLDHVYRFLVDRVVDRTISALCFQTDNKVIDGGIDGVSRSTVDTGRFLAFLHTGGIQARMLVTFAVIVFLSLYCFLG